MNYANLASAQKRAKHFAIIKFDNPVNGEIKFDGPFTVLGNTGPLIAARNHCLLLDNHDRDS